MSTASSRMSGYVNKLERQRDELLAQNERLREALTRVSKQSELDICTRLDIGSNGVRDYYISIASEALAETPAQSLEALKKEWNCPTIENGTNQHGLDVAYFRSLFNRELNGTLQYYRPSELARNLLRMARTADASVIAEDEFTGELRAQWQAEVWGVNDVSSGVVR